MVLGKWDLSWVKEQQSYKTKFYQTDNRIGWVIKIEINNEYSANFTTSIRSQTMLRPKVFLPHGIYSKKYNFSVVNVLYCIVQCIVHWYHLSSTVGGTDHNLKYTDNLYFYVQYCTGIIKLSITRLRTCYKCIVNFFWIIGLGILTNPKISLFLGG